MATTMLPPGFGGIVGVPSTYGPKVVRTLGPSFDIRDQNAPNFLISGTTKDSTGAALGNCDVHLFTTLDDLEVQQSVSDANGAYAFYVHSNVAHYIVAYKAGSPDVAGTTVDTLSLPNLIDSCSEFNRVGQTYILDSDALDLQGVGQAFNAAIGGVLSQCKFYLKKVSSPTGNAVCKLYAISGTVGTSAIPSGTALATSDAFDVSALTTSFNLVTFTFSGANRYSLQSGSNYFISLEYSGGDTSNNLTVAATFPNQHAGNMASLLSGVWTASTADDICFYVYKT